MEYTFVCSCDSKRLIVCLEESLYIHNIKDMILLHTIRDTPPNPNGLFALSTADNCFLAYPGNKDVGEVQLFDALNQVSWWQLIYVYVCLLPSRLWPSQILCSKSITCLA